MSERANALFKQGKEAYEQGKDQESYRLLRDAWALRKSSDIAANLALIESELGKYRDAAEHYSFALKNLLPSSTDAQKQALLKGLDEAKKHVCTLRLTVEPSGAEVFVDDTKIGKAPLDEEVFIDPGERVVSAKLDGHATVERRIPSLPGAIQVVWLKLRPANAPAAAASAPNAPATPPPPASPPADQTTNKRSTRSLIPAFALSGVAAAGAALGIVFTLQANSAQSDADDASGRLPPGNPCGPGTTYSSDCAKLKEANQSVEDNRNRATVSFVLAGAAGIGTIVYLLWPESDKGVSARGMISPGGGELMLRGRF